MLDVPKSLAAQRLSDRKLGAKVLEGWRKIEKRRDEFPQSEAIGVKIGLLRRADTKWWSNQRGALQALAQILGCEPEEIVAPDDTQVGGIVISAFSDLSPILPGQEGCQIRDDGSWIGAWVSTLIWQESRSWVVAPSGSGKSLTLDVLQQRYGTRVATRRCRRLVDAARMATATVPIVVEVSERDPATDEGALAELSKASTNVCVLAPFSGALVRQHLRVRWREVKWAPNADWRERLVKWANARAPKPADLDVEEVLDFLQGLDPEERLFTTPEDVLVVASRAYRSGLPRARSALRELAREHLGRVFSGSDVPWVRDFAVAAVDALIEARLSSSDFPLAPLTLEAWARLFPATLTPSSLARPTDKTKVRSIDAPGAMQALRLLVEHGVLRTQGDGHFDFAPWVRAGVEREVIARLVNAPDLDWALLAVEPSRRTAVDGALDATSPSSLLRLVRSVLSADSSELRTVAAIESLFAAVARRLAAGWSVPPEAVGDLQQLGLRQLELVRGLPEGRGFPGHPPLSRQTLEYRGDVTAAWIGEAWTFSFGVDAPVCEGDPGWILPGWSSDLRLEQAPSGLPLPQAYQRLLAAGRPAVRACKDRSIPAEIPYCLLPWVIIDGPGRGWELTKNVQYGLFHTNGAAESVGRLLQAEPPEVRIQGARTAWAAALAETEGHALNALDLTAKASRALHQVIVENVPLEDFASSFRSAPPFTMDAGHILKELPLRLLRPALVALVERVERDKQPAHDLEPILETLGEEDLELLLRFGANGYSQGYAAARRVWSLAPDTARERLRAALASGERLAQVWFDTAPADRLEDLLGILGGLGVGAPSWCASWIASVLPRAGRSAPAAYSLLRSVARHP
jgi:hypothetical protein